jgi:hypothetical protein
MRIKEEPPRRHRRVTDFGKAKDKSALNVPRDEHAREVSGLPCSRPDQGCPGRAPRASFVTAKHFPVV